MLLFLTVWGSSAQPVFRIDSLSQQGVLLDKGWKWHQGDDPKWAKPEFDDSRWANIDPAQDIHDLPQVRKARIGWFRLRLQLSPGLAEQALSIVISQAGASEIYLNGKSIYRFGVVSQDYRHEQTYKLNNEPFSIQLNRPTVQVLAVRYSFNPQNFYLKANGNTNPGIQLVIKPANIAQADFRNAIRTMNTQWVMLISLFLLLGAFSLFLYFLFPVEKFYFYLSLYCLGHFIEFLIINNSRTQTSTTTVSVLLFLSHILSLACVLAALIAYYKLFRQPKRSFFYFIVLCGAATIPVLLLDYNRGPFIAFCFYFILNIDTLRLSFQGARRHRPGSWILFATVLLFYVCFLASAVLWIIGQVDAGNVFVVIALFIVPFGISLFVAGEFARTSRSLQHRVVEVETLSAQAIAQEQEKQRILATQNETLEQQVQVRTAELADKNRELVIEAALEKIRSTSLAMRHSDEIAQVLVVLFEKLNELGLEFDGGAGIHVFTEGLKDAALWLISPQQFPTRVSLPYSEDDFIDNPIILDVWQAKETRQPIVNKTYSFEQKNRYFQYVFKHNDNTIIPEIVRNFIWSVPSYTATFIAEQNSLLGVNSWSGQLFSESDVEVLKKVARAFEQAYIRFLDLQKAEAQAREAQTEVALERVRSRTMSMQHSDELAEIISVLCKEILNLGIHHEEMETCYITTFDENKPIGEIYLTYSYGDLLPSSFQIRYDEDSLFKQIFTEWRNGNSFFIGHLEGNNLIQHFDYLFSHIPAPIVEMRSSEPTQLPSETFTHALCFSQGYLAIVTRKAVPEYHEVFKRFGSALQQAYTRFLDLKKAEAQAVQAHLDLIQIQTEKKRAEDALTELRITQTQLIQKEKLASLGELTAGIAHEIQNPLNFVNNFSEVSTELVGELKDELDRGDTEEAKAIAGDLTQNLEKIILHGRRASSIVKGMLEHSRTASGERQLTNLNALGDEYLRLAYQGLRAKDKTFNCELITNFAPDLGKVDVVPQDVGRVLLNLYNNAFYAVGQRAKQSNAAYKPVVTVSTRFVPEGDTSIAQSTGLGVIEIRVKDNGLGIPDNIREKIYQPFFTTKPTGEGTGLGLSLSYDIVTKGHGGSMEVESVEGEHTMFVVKLPVS